jgi:hypothetical protein
VPSEALIRQMMVAWGDMEQSSRETLLTGLVSYKVSRQVEGANLVMDPKFAELITPLINDPDGLEAAIEALMRLEKNRGQREKKDDSVRPTELSVVVFASTNLPPSENSATQYMLESVDAKYGQPRPQIKDFQCVALSDLDRNQAFNEDVAHVYYSRLIELEQGKNFGPSPDDAYSGKARDGTPIAAVFFWHASTGGKKKGLFRRR